MIAFNFIFERFVNLKCFHNEIFVTFKGIALYIIVRKEVIQVIIFFIVF